MTDTAPAVAARTVKRNTVVLALAQAINGSLPPIAISIGGLAGYYLLADDKTLATLPVASYNVGVALASLPAALLMRRFGRRNGFMGGAATGFAGAGVACAGVLAGNFWLFALGLLCMGFSGSFVQQYRFAAADGAQGPLKARAISWVLAGGIAAAVIGPQTVLHTDWITAPVPFAGAFAGGMALCLLGVLVLSFLKTPPVEPPPPALADGATAGRGASLLEIVTRAKFAVACGCAVGSYALMSLVMTAAPLAMVKAGCSQTDATLGIQWHVMAMFAPSFFTGSLIARFGVKTIIAAGLSILAVCALVGLSGVTVAHFWATLVLLGIGWNFGFIGATTLLTESYRPEEKSRAQGANDVILFSSVALASLSSGGLLTAFGWATLLWLVFPAVAACLIALAVLGVKERRAAA